MDVVNNVNYVKEDVISKEHYFDGLVKENFTANEAKIKECFLLFDQNANGKLDADEWQDLMQSLFKTSNLSCNTCNFQEIFNNVNELGVTFDQFKECWHQWFKKVLDPVSALVIVDVQNDFISGSLAIQNCPAKQDGAAVVPIINDMIKNAAFVAVIYSCDWHPKDHISFVENVKHRKIHHTSKVTAEEAQVMDTVVFSQPEITEQKLWPAHCVQGSWGAQLHPSLKIVENAIYVKKGMNPDVDSYSAFWDNKKFSATQLLDILTKLDVTDVYVCGLAYDICVGATALHSLEHGFRTVLVEDASKGASAADIDKTRQNLENDGAVIVNSSQVPAMVSGIDRKVQLGYFAALNASTGRRIFKESKN